MKKLVKKDAINPSHYTSHPGGIQNYEIAQHHGWAIGSAISYIWRLGLKDEPGKTKNEKSIEDIKKAIWFIKLRMKSPIKHHSQASICHPSGYTYERIVAGFDNDTIKHVMLILVKDYPVVGPNVPALITCIELLNQHKFVLECQKVSDKHSFIERIKNFIKEL